MGMALKQIEEFIRSNPQATPPATHPISFTPPQLPYTGQTDTLSRFQQPPITSHNYMNNPGYGNQNYINPAQTHTAPSNSYLAQTEPVTESESNYTPGNSNQNYSLPAVTDASDDSRT